MMYFNKKSIVYLDGKWMPAEEAKVSLYSQTMHYGNGVFEGIRSYYTEHGPLLFKARAHFDRLISSAHKMHIPLKYTTEELLEISTTLLEKNNMKDAYIRPLVFLEPNMSLMPVENAHLFMGTWKWDRYYGDNLQKVMISSYERPQAKCFHADTKTVGHYTNSILASTEARSKGFDEGLLLDVNGYVAQGAASNFFIEKDGKLFTSKLGNVFPGITRSTIQDLCKQLHVEVEEKNITVDEAKSADSAFLVGTATEVAGVSHIDDVTLGLKWENSIGRQLSRMYQLEVRQVSNYESTFI